MACSVALAQQPTVPRLWIDETLDAIRNDFARPPIHARNLFHISAAMYDAWAIYDTEARPWLIGNTVHGFESPFLGVPPVADVEAARKEAMSYAAYRILNHRFFNSPGASTTFARIGALMDSLGYAIQVGDVNYTQGSPAALGNYIAQQYIAFGLQDGSNEEENYSNLVYYPINPGVEMVEPGNPFMFDPNRWQPITLPVSIDQAGNPVSSTPPFVAPEWGNVLPFALSVADLDILERDGFPWNVYLDPGPPAYLDVDDPAGLESDYKWNHLLVSIWQSHLDPADETWWDISPGAIGNNSVYPQTRPEYEAFYDLFEGGDGSPGHPVNPATGQPYAPNMAKRGDYARILAEFWADGIDSETPPGHWFEILHDVMDLPAFERRWMGEGPELDPMEYDSKAQFALGAAMHDAAIAAWSVKGYYDYVRPVSAIRYMADRGQCADPLLPRYHPAGVPLIPGHIELVTPGDPLAGDDDEHVDKIKLFTYRGPTVIDDPETEVAGVDWILAENWWPYQRPTFVTPPFAGYVSGHSTFSRTAAELLTAITGSRYLPGGMLEYVIPQNAYLEFEMGPSEEVRLQWATYQDASDACSLSRIWGGIHPPIDDIPGRLMGIELGPRVAEHADRYVTGGQARVDSIVVSDPSLTPTDVGGTFVLSVYFNVPMDTTGGLQVAAVSDDPFQQFLAPVGTQWVGLRQLDLHYSIAFAEDELHAIRLSFSGLVDTTNRPLRPHLAADPFRIDMRSPTVDLLDVSAEDVELTMVGPSAFRIAVTFSEPCDPSVAPVFVLAAPESLAGAFVPNVQNSAWITDIRYEAWYDVVADPVGPTDVQVRVGQVVDLAGNIMELEAFPEAFRVDLRAPQLMAFEASAGQLAIADLGSIAWTLSVSFSEPMDTTMAPELSFSNGSPLDQSLVLNPVLSTWENDSIYRFVFALLNAGETWSGLEAMVTGHRDRAGNPGEDAALPDLLSMDTQRPVLASVSTSALLLSDADASPLGLEVLIEFSEPMDTNFIPLVQPMPEGALAGSLVFVPGAGAWIANDRYRALFHVSDEGVEVPEVELLISQARDAAGNGMTIATSGPLLELDTRNPALASSTAVPGVVGDAQLGLGGLVLELAFDEPMDPSASPAIEFIDAGELTGVLVLNEQLSQWTSADAYAAVYDVYAAPLIAPAVGVTVTEALDAAGNPMEGFTTAGLFSIQLSGVGIAELNDLPGFQVVPNPVPAGQAIRLTWDRAVLDIPVTLVDARGREVFSTRVTAAASQPVALGIPGVAPGPYLLVHWYKGLPVYRTLVID